MSIPPATITLAAASAKIAVTETFPSTVSRLATERKFGRVAASAMNNIRMAAQMPGKGAKKFITINTHKAVVSHLAESNFII